MVVGLSVVVVVVAAAVVVVVLLLLLPLLLLLLLPLCKGFGHRVDVVFVVMCIVSSSHWLSDVYTMLSLGAGCYHALQLVTPPSGPLELGDWFNFNDSIVSQARPVKRERERERATECCMATFEY